MGKMMGYALLTVFLIEIGMYYFAGTHVALSGLLEAMQDPTSILTNGWYLLMLAILITSAAATITPTFFAQVNQWGIFAAGCALMLTYIYVLADFWAFLHNGLGGIGGGISTFAGLIATMITTPLIVLYATAMIEWSRFNQ